MPSRDVGSVLILTGPPGAGKSTVADLLTRGQRRAVHLHTDDFYDRYIKGGYILPWLPEAQAQNETVSRVLAATAFTYAAGGYWVVIDGIVGPWFLDVYRAASKTHGLALAYAVLRTDADTSVRRVRERQTHGLEAEDVVRHLHRQFSDLGELEPHVVEASVSPEQVAEHVRAGMAAGRLALE
jgi:tRNA uridine 5-carbamoylmethylation protein Kti12